jgi:hypothetical protein
MAFLHQGTTTQEDLQTEVTKVVDWIKLVFWILVAVAVIWMIFQALGARGF